MRINASLFLGILCACATLSPPAQGQDTSTFSLAPGDVVEATISTAGFPRLKVTLTPKKGEELSRITSLNLGKQVKIVVGGKLSSEPLIRERMTGPAMELYVQSPEDALNTVKALLTSPRLRFEQLANWTDFNGTHYAERLPDGVAAPRASTGTVKVPQELQGSWVVAKATMNSRESHDPTLLEANWNFQRDELTLESPQKGTARFRLRMDETVRPRAFYLTSTEPANTGAGWMLFARETNTLKIAFFDNLEGRPESFEPREPRSKPELVVVTLSPKPRVK
jgi:uncharacterized protein (TIGR03067 family)